MNHETAIFPRNTDILMKFVQRDRDDNDHHKLQKMTSTESCSENNIEQFNHMIRQHYGINNCFKRTKSEL